MFVHSYARFSTGRQQLGDSERRQIEAAEDYCKRNGHTLSDLQLIDRGWSGFRGNKQTALNEFLKMIETGEVKPGEILLVESVDRLSRKGIMPTQMLINRILSAGIHIAILMPYENLYSADDPNDLGGQIQLAAFAYQAHVYSLMLSGRIKSWWTENRKKAQEDGRIITGIIPCWLEKENGAFKVKPQARNVIEYIFHRTIEGIGAGVLVKELNEKFEAIGGRQSKHFNKTFITTIIRKRQVLGEYQPHKLDDKGKRQPVGEPLPDYYPRVIDEKTWLAANAAASNRRVERGPSGDFVNVFVNLIHHAVDDCRVHITTTRQTRADGRKVTQRRYK